MDRKELRPLFRDDLPPIVHGNGFIQVELTDGRRAHFWGDPRIPRQKVYTGIHDHRFSFRSEVVTGRMVNLSYTSGLMMHASGTHRIYRPETREGEGTILSPDVTGARVTPTRAQVDVVPPGGFYRMEGAVFHETFTPEPTISVMTKTGTTSHTPRVLVPFDKEPDNDFHRHKTDIGLLRQIILDMLA